MCEFNVGEAVVARSNMIGTPEERSAANASNNELPATVSTKPVRKYPYREHRHPKRYTPEAITDISKVYL